MNLQGETWRFEVRGQSADRVYLVADRDDRFRTWMEMDKAGPGKWQLTAQLAPGRYRMRYFTAEGTLFFNGGNFGLNGERIDAKDEGEAVVVDELEPYAQSA